MCCELPAADVFGPRGQQEDDFCRNPVFNVEAYTVPRQERGAPMGGATRLIEHVRWGIATRQASGSAQVEFSFHFFAGSLEKEKAAMRLWLSMLSSAAATRSPVSGGGSCERRQCCDQFVSAQSCSAPLYTDLV